MNTFISNDLAIEKCSHETELLLNKYLRKLTSPVLNFTENVIDPVVFELFQERGVEVRAVMRQISTKRPELNLDFFLDLLLISNDCCILITIRNNLSIDDIDEHLEEIEKFKPLFPKYADKKAFGAVAGMVISDNVAKYAYRKGFFVIGQTDDSVRILNDQKFQPTAW